MKFIQPIFLLTLSIATALTLFSEAAPSPSSLNKQSSPTLAPNDFAAAGVESISSKHQQSHQVEQRQKRGGLSRRPVSTGYNSHDHRAPSSSPSSSSDHKGNGSSSSATKKRTLEVEDEEFATKIDQRSIRSVKRMSANSQQLRQPSRGTSDENRASAPTSAQKRQHRKSITKKRAHYSTPPPPPSLKKRALPDSVNAAAAGSPKKNTPLLLLPDSRSIWHTGTYQTVRWNRKYTKRLPLDTTVDVVLIDSKTNRKINSLKRFVPFKKGGCQVWVPTNLPESASFVLVLELYRGRSQEQVINTSASSSTSQDSSAKKPYHYREGQKQKSDGESLINKNDNGSVSTPPATTTDVFSRIMRRSEVNIAASSKKRQVPQYPPSSPYAGSNSNSYNNNHQPGSNPPSNHNNKVPSGTHHDINHDDFYTGSIQERPMDFLPDELRQEYPNTVRPLVLEHTFGLHQKVYTLTPYTLAWKIPDRVGELLEYTRQAQALFNTISKLNTVSQASAATWYPKSTFLAKVLVELVKDETMESVAIMAKDVPAETMFLYLSIQDRLPPAFYRLRVQMVVVQVRTDYNALVNGSPTTSSPAAKAALEGWEFPEGGEVIDRHEAITRKFWVSQGAL